MQSRPARPDPLRAPSAAPRARGSSAGRAGCAGTAPPTSRRFRTCCRSFARPSSRGGRASAAASSSCSSSASASSQTSPYVRPVVGGDRSDARPRRRRPGGKPRGRARRRTRPTGSARRAGARAGPLLVGEPAEPLDERRILGAGQELQLAELDRLEPAGRGELLAELQEVLRRHRLQYVDLVTRTRSMTCIRPADAAPTSRGRAQHRVTSGRRLVQQLLEPQLVHLVDGDEQQLVVRRWVGLQVLRVEQRGQLQIGAVGQPGALLSEADAAVAPVPVTVPSVLPSCVTPSRYPCVHATAAGLAS